MKAVLLNVARQSIPSPGVLQLYLYLRSKGVDIEYADVNRDEKRTRSLKRAIKRNPASFSWIGLASDFQSKKQVSRFVRKLREWGYQGHISLGGQFPTMYPEDYFENAPIDSVVLGPGERVVEELLRRLETGEDWHAIPGLAFPSDQGIQCNPNTFETLSWDEIPESMDLIAINDLNRSAYISSSGIESCPNNCTWCPDRFVARAAGQPRRATVHFKPAARLKKEIRYVIDWFDNWFEQREADVRPTISVYVVDCDAFSTPELLERNQEIASWMVNEIHPELQEKDMELAWFLWGSTRSLLPLSKEYLDSITVSRCIILIGVESFSDSQLRRLGKGVTREENLAVLRKLELLGRGVLMIMWDPWSTAQEMLDNWTGYMSVLQCPKPPDMSQVDKYLELLPGTPMYRRFMREARRYKMNELGGIYAYDILDPDVNRLKNMLSEFVHCWEDLRRAQQRLCEDDAHPLHDAFAARGINRCTFCEHRPDDELGFKETFLRLIELAVDGNAKWWEEADRVAYQAIMSLRADMEGYIFDGQTLFELAMEHASAGVSQ